MSPRVSTAEELAAVLSAQRTTLVADLSLGSSRAHSVARQLLAQLRIEPALPRLPAAAASKAGGKTLSYGHLIDQHVDAEAKGDTAMVLAFALSKQFAASGTQTAAVLAPRFGLDWAREDRAFLQLCATMGIDIAVIECTDDEPANAPLHLAATVPGVLDSPLASLLAVDAIPHLRLESGAVIVGPEARRQPGAATRLVFDRLGATVEDDDLQAFAQLHGSNFHVDAALLSRQAWRNFELGGSDLALALLERARACASSASSRAALLCQVQGMRIAGGQWERGAALDDPPDSLPASLRQFLLESKGWSLVMSNRPDDAALYVDRAWRLLEGMEESTRERLYLLNIRALCCFRRNELDAALALEKEIERGLAALSPTSWPLLYVNAINQARLYRRMKDFDRSAEYYARAFDTTLGARTESDTFYANACTARIEQDRGHADAALAAWLRASIHWCAATLPEAVSRRALAAVLTQVPESPFAYDEAVSAALLERLVNLAGDMHGGRAVPFVRADQVADRSGRFLSVHGAAGWCVVAYRGKVGTQRRSAAALSALQSWLAAWIAREAPYPDETDALLVDDRGGCEVAVSEGEALETAVRWGARNVAFGGRAFNLEETDAIQRATLRIAPHVTSLEETDDGARVTFKRYLAPRDLDAAELALVSSTSTGGRIPASAIRSVERCGVVVMRLAGTESQWTMDGTRLPSTASSVLV